MTDPILPPEIKNVNPPEESKFSKNINRAITLALIAIGLGIAVLFYWGIQNDKVITLNEEPFPTRTIRDHPTAGGVVFLTTNMCKSNSVVGEMRLSFVSKTTEVFLPLDKEDKKKGCYNEELAVLIPNDIVPDTYRVKMRVAYDINPLKQDVTQIFYSYPVIIDPVSADNKLPPNTKLQVTIKGAHKPEV